ncbi:MAG: cell division protein ZapA [Clostridia bacterium]|nr:cell division protein ZapA [Clostridia bacterium]
MEKNRVKVTIGGISYSLTSDDDAAYIKKVAGLVDTKMKEIGEANSYLTNYSKAVLTAINIADDFLKRNDKVREVINENEQLKRRINELERRFGKR